MILVEKHLKSDSLSIYLFVYRYNFIIFSYIKGYSLIIYVMSCVFCDAFLFVILFHVVLSYVGVLGVLLYHYY